MVNPVPHDFSHASVDERSRWKTLYRLKLWHVACILLTGAFTGMFVWIKIGWGAGLGAGVSVATGIALSFVLIIGYRDFFEQRYQARVKAEGWVRRPPD